MKPPFGTPNTKVANTIAANSPAYRRIVEPFGDGGTYALHVGHRPPKEHVVNIVDAVLFGAMLAAQSAGLAERARLKAFDWVASQVAFDAATSITATEGPDALYRFLYVKAFGMRMAPGEPPAFDAFKAGQDEKSVLWALPLMRSLLKRVTLVNGEPAGVMSGGGSDTLWILTPKTPDDVAAAQSRMAGLGGSVFFAAAVADPQAVIDDAQKFGGMVVSPLSVASIMMKTYEVVTNFDTKLQTVDEITQMAAGGM